MYSKNKYINDYLTYLKSKGYSKNTIVTRERSLSKFLKWLNTRGLSVLDVITKDIIDFQLSLKKLKMLSVACHFTAVKLFYRWMKENTFILVDPCENLTMEYKDKRLPKILTQKEITDLFETIPVTTIASKRNRAMLELAYSSLLRREELINLKLSDFDFANNTVRVKRKGGIEALLPFGEIAKNCILLYLSEEKHVSDSPYLWLNEKTGDKLSYNSFNSIFTQIKKTTGITLSLHTLRRSGATHMLQNGANLAVIKEMLSHNSYKAVKHYLRLCVEDLHKTLKKSEFLK